MSTNKKGLSFNDLKLEQVVFELRFPMAYLYFDIAGSLWEEVTKALPGTFAIDTFEANGSTITLNDKFQISIGVDSLGVIGYFPNKSLKDFTDILDIVYTIAIERLKIESIIRVGLRLIFIKEYESLKTLGEMLCLLPCIKIPDGITFGSEDESILPSANIRVEDKVKGRLFRVSGSIRSFTVDLPIVDVAEKGQRVTQGQRKIVFVFDVDTFTKITIPIGQLSIIDWIKQSYESVKDTSPNFFKE
jgi:hypothetical protein